jgi:hypothetical protein
MEAARLFPLYFPTPYSSQESELERNLMIRTAAGPHHSSPPAYRAESEGRLRYLSRIRYQGRAVRAWTFAGIYPDLLLRSKRRTTSPPPPPEDHELLGMLLVDQRLHAHSIQSKLAHLP